MRRELRDSHDTVVLRPVFGVLFRDHFDGRIVADGLRVAVRREDRGEWQQLQGNSYGAFAMHALPGLRPPLDASPPTARFRVRVDDTRGRFLPLQFGADLPADGLYDPLLAAASPPPREPAVALHSAPTRLLSAAAGIVRATLRRASQPDLPASWARVELWLDATRLGEGVADVDGNLLLPCRLPPPREPPLHGSPPAPPAGFDRLRWDVTLRAHWDPRLAGRERPDLHVLHRQPEAALLRRPGWPASPTMPLPPQVLRPGAPLVVRGDGSSFLFVGA